MRLGNEMPEEGAKGHFFPCIGYVRDATFPSPNIPHHLKRVGRPNLYSVPSTLARDWVRGDTSYNENAL